jgi:hypothetical protein
MLDQKYKAFLLEASKDVGSDEPTILCAACQGLKAGCFMSTEVRSNPCFNYPRKLRSQTSDLWTDAATAERRVRRNTGRREEATEEKESGERRSKCTKR